MNITSGDFVFSTAEAYLIENGKITTSVKGVKLIGRDPEATTRTSMIGNDMALDPVSAPAAKKARAYRSASASRRCASMV